MSGWRVRRRGRPSVGLGRVGGAALGTAAGRSLAAVDFHRWSAPLLSLLPPLSLPPPLSLLPPLSLPPPLSLLPPLSLPPPLWGASGWRKRMLPPPPGRGRAFAVHQLAACPPVSPSLPSASLRGARGRSASHHVHAPRLPREPPRSMPPSKLGERGLRSARPRERDCVGESRGPPGQGQLLCSPVSAAEGSCGRAPEVNWRAPSRAQRRRDRART